LWGADRGACGKLTSLQRCGLEGSYRFLQEPRRL
jgi:hypothetical protein